MCLSAFARIRRRGRALVGAPAAHARWAEWMPSWAHFDPADVEATMGGWLVPGTYLLEGEDPRKALDRVMRKMMGIRSYALAEERPLVYSVTAASGWYPGHAHWDLAFVYDVEAGPPARMPPWWREVAWKRPADLRARSFHWNADLALALGIARR